MDLPYNGKVMDRGAHNERPGDAEKDGFEIRFTIRAGAGFAWRLSRTGRLFIFASVGRVFEIHLFLPGQLVGLEGSAPSAISY